MPPTAPARSPPTASRSICRRRAKAASCPISTRSTTRCWRAPSPSTSPRRRTRKARSPSRAYLDKLAGLARRFGFLVFADECYCEIYSEHAAGRHAGSLRARLRQRRRVPLAVQALEPARPARRLCRRRPPLPCRLSRTAQRRRAAGAGAGATRRRRRLWRRGACARKTASFIRPNSISPTRSSATATATNARPADFFSGSTSRNTAAAKS